MLSYNLYLEQHVKKRECNATLFDNNDNLYAWKYLYLNLAIYTR